MKRHNPVYIFSSKHIYRPMRARVVAQLFYKIYSKIAVTTKNSKKSQIDRKI